MLPPTLTILLAAAYDIFRPKVTQTTSD